MWHMHVQFQFVCQGVVTRSNVSVKRYKVQCGPKDEIIQFRLLLSSCRAQAPWKMPRTVLRAR